MINGFEIIDAHCHIYPEKIASVAIAGTDKFYGEKSIYDGTVGTLISEVTKVGSDKFIVAYFDGKYNKAYDHGFER